VLDGLSFEIEPGEGVGLVGVNGAGKTTLLKVISGLVAPTTGNVAVGGRVVALLAMGVGLRHHLTGRENIWFGGLLFGMNRSEIAASIDDIVSFADLGPAIDQPYFTYSTGMRSRLGFALATSTPGDIYILDETLATGDVRFVAKCYQRIKAIRDSGKTVLFVSHNLGEIARMTKRVLVLDKGHLLFDGNTDLGLEVYESVVHSPKASFEQKASEGVDDLGEQLVGGLRATVKLQSAAGESGNRFLIGQPLEMFIDIDSGQDLGPCYLNLFVYEVTTGQPVCYLSPGRWQSLSTQGALQSVIDVQKGNTALTGSVAELTLGEGEYKLDLRIDPVDAQTGLARGSTRTFRSVADLFVTYGNSRFKGAGTLLELPSGAWQVSS
jgi:ABC-type polysaccharide/polyol phosphate transport system ATPase subunit